MQMHRDASEVSCRFSLRKVDHPHIKDDAEHNLAISDLVSTRRAESAWASGFGPEAVQKNPG